jgi:hypothetical protein
LFLSRAALPTETKGLSQNHSAAEATPLNLVVYFYRLQKNRAKPFMAFFTHLLALPFPFVEAICGQFPKK